MLKNQSERGIQRGFGGECRDGDKIQVMQEFQNEFWRLIDHHWFTGFNFR